MINNTDTTYWIIPGRCLQTTFSVKNYHYYIILYNVLFTALNIKLNIKKGDIS